jgi:hypothetical protein
MVADGCGWLHIKRLAWQAQVVKESQLEPFSAWGDTVLLVNGFLQVF